MGLLEQIKKPSDLKQLNIKQLPTLAEEIRQLIISVSSENGGHLASSLGAVDAIVALYYVFDFPKDKLIFDVGHQAYAHKILSERRELFETIRCAGGLSGFPNVFESEYDAFTVGHAGTSISASLGYANARDLLGEDYFVISFVGDGSFFNGENLEALMSVDEKPKKFLIVLNDNGMSISKNTNGLYKVASKISMKRRYSKFMDCMDKVFGWNFIGKGLKRIKAMFKRSLDSFSILDKVGIKYVGAFDGNNVCLLVRLFQNFKSSPRTTLLHIKTQKGKGYEPAEKQSELFHGVSKNFNPAVNSFSENLGKTLVEIAKTNEKIVTITAGMTFGTGLTEFKEKFPKRFFDVGISEEFAVTFSAGLALAGLKPIVCIYSTFLQRSYDQILTDVCLQNVPVIFMIDRAGFVGSDGSTHQGLYDLSYLRNIPNVKIFSPKDTLEFNDVLNFSLSLNCPVAIRYSNGFCQTFENHQPIDENNLWETVKVGRGPCILAVGSRCLKVALEGSKDTDAMVINARSIKPLDETKLRLIDSETIITVEENTKIGGFGSAVLEFFAENNISKRVKLLGANDEFVEHATVFEQMKFAKITAEEIKKIIEEV